MTRPAILLLYGGESSEHDVSINSARNVYAAIDGDKYDTLLCYIDRRGKWWLLDEWADNLEHHGGRQLLAALGMSGFMTMPGQSIVHPDVILPVLHGKNGEDGTVQGLAALLHIPIVGCDTAASAVCMDKILTKQILATNNIRSAEYLVYLAGTDRPSYQEIVEKLGQPFFVKPSRSGSSIGVSKVHDESEYHQAVDEALRHDSRVLIEETISGRELETAVLGNPPHQIVSGVGEIIAAAEFYDYEDKYSRDSASQVLTKIEISESLERKIRETSRRAYEVLGCSGLARIDYLVTDETVYVIEVNTFPGFTNISMYPKLWREQGMQYSSLIDALIETALQ